MAIRPSLKRAVPETLNKASDYNDNFDLMMDFVDASVLESKNYIEGYIPPVTGQSGKFMTNNGTVASWEIVIPAGTTIFYSGSSAPSGWLVCDGSAISRTTYAALFSAIGTNFGEGNGETTFNLPNLINKFAEGGSGSGTYIDAGLPNITGTWGSGWSNGDSRQSGAFTRSYASGGSSATNGTNGFTNWLSFNASNSNSIYGNSETVQPPALTMLPVIKY